LGDVFKGIRKPPEKLQGPLASIADNSGAFDALPQDGRYRYSPLASAQHPDAIQLVQNEPGTGAEDIRCSVIHTTLSQAAGTYEALSYTWGHEGVKEDIVERNTQVAVMCRIYQLANHVVTFLGDGSEDSDLIMDFLAVFQIDNGPTGTSKQESPLEFDHRRALLNLFKRPWFYRVWVLQEVFKCLFGNALIVCGDRWIDWSTLMYLRIVLDDIHEKSLFKHETCQLLRLTSFHFNHTGPFQPAKAFSRFSWRLGTLIPQNRETSSSLCSSFLRTLPRRALSPTILSALLKSLPLSQQTSLRRT
jgi:hypothetical protein